MGLLDFLVDWNITTLVLVAFVLMLVLLGGSFGVAFAWRKWKEGRRHRAAMKGPAAPTGVGFAKTASVLKLPKREGGSGLPKPSLPRLRRKP